MRLLDRKFKYVPAVKTDIRKTIRRELRRIAADQERERQAAPATGRVRRIK